MISAVHINRGASYHWHTLVVSLLVKEVVSVDLVSMPIGTMAVPLHVGLDL